MGPCDVATEHDMTRWAPFVAVRHAHAHAHLCTLCVARAEKVRLKARSTKVQANLWSKAYQYIFVEDQAYHVYIGSVLAGEKSVWTMIYSYADSVLTLMSDVGGIRSPTQPSLSVAPTTQTLSTPRYEHEAFDT